MQPQLGSFIPTSNIWDIGRLQEVDVNSDEFKELLVRLYQNVNNIAINVNLKDTGYYPLIPFVCGQQFFPNPALSSQTSPMSSYRSPLRLTINFGQLPNAGVKTVPHNIPVNSGYSWTRIYATATDQTGLTGIDISNINATIEVTATDVVITTTSNLSNYNVVYVVLEYIIN